MLTKALLDIADNLAYRLNKAVQMKVLAGRVTACVCDNAKTTMAANNPTRDNCHFLPCIVYTLHMAIMMDLPAICIGLLLQLQGCCGTSIIAPLLPKHWKASCNKCNDQLTSLCGPANKEQSARLSKE